MKLKIFLLSSLFYLSTYINSINLKAQIEELKNLEGEFATDSHTIENYKFKEKQWGGVFNSLKKGAKELNKASGGAVSNALTKGVGEIAKASDKAIGGVAKAAGVDASKLQKTVDKTAGKVKTAINCFFGKCEDGKTPPKPPTPVPSNNPPTPVPSNNPPKPVNPVKPTPPSKNNTQPQAPSKNNTQPQNPSKKNNTIIPITPFPSNKNNTSSNNTKKPTDESFEISKKKVQSGIDPRYIIMKTQDDFMNPDNTIRFIASDSTNLESVSLKLYFKGKPSNGHFYQQSKDPTFMNSVNECKNHKVITNRLYGKSASNAVAIDDVKDQSIFEDIKLPRCLTVPDMGNLETDYINIMTLPEGKPLDKKCLHGDGLNKGNSCMTYMRTISSGLLHSLKLFNMGHSYFRHANIYPHNIYLLIKNDTQRVFLDNMLYDSNKYDDISQKPFRRDMNLMADSLIQLITGSNSTIVKEPIESTFKLYHSIKKYIWDNSIDLSMKSAAINFPGNLKEGSGKCITMTEFEFKLQKSFFNFIYRLKCTGIDKYNQFMDIDQALNHDFITSGLLTGPKAPGEQWDTLPADF